MRKHSRGWCVYPLMHLAAWTICSSCCEAHLSKLACPRCTGTTSRAAHKRIEIPAAAQPKRSPSPSTSPGPRLKREVAAGAGRKVGSGSVVAALVFITGLVLAGLTIMPVLGIVLTAVPVIVMSVVRSRERRAERQGPSATLGIPLS